MLPIYIGWDGLDHLAYEVCVKSLLKHSSIPLKITALRDWELRQKGLYYRPYDVDERGQRFDGRDGKPFSTDFSFTRFLVPALEHYDSEWAIFVDPDVLFKDDVAGLVSLLDDKYSLMCVQHEHRPTEMTKMAGQIQTRYARKNWSSLMAFKPWKNKTLTKYMVNTQPGNWLHGLRWLQDEEIGSIPEEWNWLCGWSDPAIEPKMVHFTRGTPDLPGCEDEPYASEWREYVRENRT